MTLGSTQTLIEMSTRRISCGYKRPLHKADNLSTSCAVVMKSGNLQFLEPSGPLQACNGTALPYPLRASYLRFGKDILLDDLHYTNCNKFFRIW